MLFLHLGDHATLTTIQTLSHFLEVDHLALAALTVLVGWAAYRLGRRTEARAIRVRSQNKDIPS